MITKILFFIIHFQAIRWTISWDPLNPLVLNKNGNEILFPLRVEKVDGVSKEITYVDPRDESTVTYTFCTDYSSPGGLLGKLFKEDPSRICPHSMDYDREAIKDPKGKTVLCGNQNEQLDSGYKMYRAEVKLNIDGNTSSSLTFPLYNYCFDDQHNYSTLYAYYDLGNPSLLKNPLLSDERNHAFDPLTWPTFDQPDVDLSRYYKAQSVYIPYEVAVSKFIPFANWRKAFIQWHNIAPMNHLLQNPWEKFIEKIALKLAEKTEHITVLSGIHGMKRNGSVEFLSNSKITIPEYWWILLYNKDKTRGISLIMNNYSYAKGQHHDLLCEVSVCDKAKLQEAIPQDEESKHVAIYCCSASTLSSKVTISSDLVSETNEVELLVFDESV
ncbi:uncharacterized protein LOC135844325 [Planococcus citri]|uniref:uncharacterized protein LOC135844325 n=1 Tax=Planococcus citri TaxID=170843 RepID=UPI0031F8F7C8